MSAVSRGSLLLAALLAGAPAAAQPLVVAAASDLQAVLPAVAGRFERESGGKVVISFGSSGNFFAQIQNGAPFDLFLSADIDYPRTLEASRLAEPGSLYEYARGRIVLWSRRDAGVDVERGLAALADPRVKRVAIANPDHAPYGRAAVAALQHAGLYEQVRGKLVLGENISQAAQFAQSGNADAAIVALALALGPALGRVGSFVHVPEASYPPIRQGAVILRSSRQKEAARRFLDFLKRPESVKLFQDFGFSVDAASAGPAPPAAGRPVAATRR